MPKHRGFTLIELLVVVAIIAILAVIVMVALDPVRQFKEARNARRWSDVNTISTGVYRYLIEKSAYPPGLDESKRQIGTAQSGCNQACPDASDSCLNLQTSLADYLPLLPTELNGGTSEKTGYMISKSNGNNVITVVACGAENGTSIYVMR